MRVSGRNGDRALWVALWVVVVAVAFAARPLWPVDETRYAAVAWEMWARGDFLVPYLNGEPYSHKAPLLFWLMHAGWAAFGVNEWWPRLVPALAALANLFLTARLAGALWPQGDGTRTIAPWILFGFLPWMLFVTPLMFDMLLASFVLLGMLGLWRASQEGGWRGWLWFGGALGFGVLIKGPVTLLHLLPAAVLAPVWIGGQRPRWTRWYAQLLVALGLGVVIALAWAIPAGMRGGDQYRDAIFWGQTAGRVVSSFAHAQPWWWYLAILPIVFFPWIFWPHWWRALRCAWEAPWDAGTRFCLVWLGAGFLGLSLISGKQVYYLLPLLPAAALLAARALRELPGDQAHVLAVVRKLTGVSALVIVGANVIAAFTIAPAAEMTRIARFIAAQQQSGYPVAHLGKYHGQYHFAGRLREPLSVVQCAQLEEWGVRHPQGRVVGYVADYRAANPAVPVAPSACGHAAVPLLCRPYLRHGVCVWRASELR